MEVESAEQAMNVSAWILAMRRWLIFHNADLDGPNALEKITVLPDFHNRLLASVDHSGNLGVYEGRLCLRGIPVVPKSQGATNGW